MLVKKHESGKNVLDWEISVSDWPTGGVYTHLSLNIHIIFTLVFHSEQDIIQHISHLLVNSQPTKQDFRNFSVEIHDPFYIPKKTSGSFSEQTLHQNIRNSFFLQIWSDKQPVIQLFEKQLPLNQIQTIQLFIKVQNCRVWWNHQSRDRSPQRLLQKKNLSAGVQQYGALQMSLTLTLQLFDNIFRTIHNFSYNLTN